MYLARKQINKTTRYFLRQSVSDGRSIRSRDLVDLGCHPEKYIIYPDDGNTFYFDDRLCEAIKAKGVEPDDGPVRPVGDPGPMLTAAPNESG